VRRRICAGTKCGDKRTRWLPGVRTERQIEEGEKGSEKPEMSFTFSRTIKGWLPGCGDSTAVIVAFTWAVVASASASSVDLARGTGGVLLSGLLFFLLICLLTAVPAAAVIWWSERRAISSIWFLGGAGALMGTLAQLAVIGLFGGTGRSFIPSTLVVAGFAAGVAYWWVAGRHAGAVRLWPVPDQQITELTAQIGTISRGHA